VPSTIEIEILLTVRCLPHVHYNISSGLYGGKYLGLEGYGRFVGRSIYERRKWVYCH
jgi:hypothetical protein